MLGKPTAAGIFLQFNFKPDVLTKLVVPRILKAGAAYGFNTKLGMRDPQDPILGSKRVIVEFSSPNIAKPFHAGHLRSTIIGGFLANMYQAAGWDVVRMNYLGDWGTQFGMLALAWQKFGDEEKLLANPIGHLYDIYVQINRLHEPEHTELKERKQRGEDTTQLYEQSLGKQAHDIFRRMEEGDKEMLALWRRFRELSIARYKETYARLNIRYDLYSGESHVRPTSMGAAVRALKKKGLLHESDDGAQLVDFEQHVPGAEGRRLGKCRVRKADGTTLYLTRDIGAALERFDGFSFDKMLYVVATQQDLHMQQLFKLLELIGRGDVAERCQHVSFGMVMGMSSRRGTVKFLDDIIRDVADKMHEVMRTNAGKYAQVENPEQVAETLGITSIMVQDMSAKR